MTHAASDLAICTHCGKSMVPRLVIQHSVPSYSVCPHCAGTYKIFSPTQDEITRAKWPHEIFLINLVFNHILVFASTFGVFSTFPLMVLIVPLTSFTITAYIFVRAKQIAVSGESAFIKAHWVVADRRNKHFMWLLATTCILIGGGFWISKVMGWSKIATIALLGGFGLLPFMVALLVLIVLGNDSMYQARHCKFPRGYTPASITAE